MLRPRQATTVLGILLLLVPAPTATGVDSIADDVTLIVVEPREGATYAVEAAQNLGANVDIKFGEGPISDAVR